MLRSLPLKMFAFSWRQHRLLSSVSKNESFLFCLTMMTIWQSARNLCGPIFIVLDIKPVMCFIIYIHVNVTYELKFPVLICSNLNVVLLHQSLSAFDQSRQQPSRHGGRDRRHRPMPVLPISALFALRPGVENLPPRWPRRRPRRVHPDVQHRPGLARRLVPPAETN